jgi:uncharacterized protein YndB with AHSA1/START domain
MRSVTVALRRRFDGEPARVYATFLAVLWDGGAGLPPRPVIEEPGDAAGRGRTRRIGTGRFAVRERIEEAEPAARLVYRVLPGSPTFPSDDHRGVIDFFADPRGGTWLRWRISFTAPRRRAPLMIAMARSVLLTYPYALARALRRRGNS